MADWEFDQAKDAANLAKHGISLSRAADLVDLVVFSDERFEEERYRAYGRIDGATYCLAYTRRGERRRAISLRRCHDEEFRGAVAAATGGGA